MRLSENEVHVWCATFDVSTNMEVLSRNLSPEERERASRYRFGLHRDRYVMARGLLRELLSTYVGIPPSDIEFCYNEFGKPFLAHESDPTIRFNLSHSGDLMVFAFADADLGVDVEMIRPDLATYEIAERFFSPTEVKALSALSPEVQPRAFFNCWARKEAYVKACGQGLSMPLSDFAVSLRPGEAPSLLWHVDSDAMTQWSLVDLPVPQPYVGAAAVRLSRCTLRYTTLSVAEFALAKC